MSYRFETVDVFTDQRFGGNPLAVFPDARGMSGEEMQALAREFNLSESTFVLPPDDSANTARVRIFTPVHEMPFAGHPSVGTAYVLARHGRATDGMVRMEVPAGLVVATILTDDAGAPSGARFTAPQPLSTGPTVDRAAIAACLGLEAEAVRVASHEPMEISCGNPFVAAELEPGALGRCLPDLGAFRHALQPWMDGHLSLFVYVRDGDRVRARMFAPLSSIVEDPATGSANAPLGALLLQLDGGDAARFTVRQGVEMGRPSLLIVEAERTVDGILAHVSGTCVAMLKGETV